MRIYIKNKVENLINTYNTTNPIDIVKELDITLIHAPLGSIWGMYKYIKRNKTIYINSDLGEFEQRFVLAHELGHAVLHPKSTCFFTNTLNSNKLKKEYEANIFASELLITDIDKLWLRGYSLNQLAAYYNVPTDLIKFKFDNNKK